MTPKLFISFSPNAAQAAFDSLHVTLTAISQWMASNFLTLNPSKTEFLIIGLPTNSLNFICQILHFLTTHQSHPWNQQEISVSSSTQTFPSTNTYLIFQRLATIISVTSDAYAQPWTSTLPVPSPHLWFILNLTTATLSTTTFHSHNSSDSRLSKTPWLVASLPALVFNT